MAVQSWTPGQETLSGGDRTPATDTDVRASAEAVLARGLVQHFGPTTEPAAVAWSPEPEQSTHRVDRLHVTLQSGGEISVIFKRFHPAPANAGPGRRGKGGPREVLIYRRILAGGRFGAPLVYASAYDTRRARYWLFLEDVGASTLRKSSVDVWRAAVAWLAGMHGTFLGREDELRRLVRLPRERPDRLKRLAAIARHNLIAVGSPHLPALERAITALRPLQIAGQTPRTLIHGDIFAGNLAVQPGPVIRALDWEQARIGEGAQDLADLLDGWAGAAREALIDLYLDAIAQHSRVPLDTLLFRRTLAWNALLVELRHLAWDQEACADSEHVARHLERLMGAVEMSRAAAVG